jgi:NADH-quinone oxidoreductase subunit G
MASQRLFEAVPFYAGLTLDEIGGRGLRWPAREASHAAFAGSPWQPVALDVPSAPSAPPEGALRLGTFRSLWTSKEVDASPILQYARPSQVVELSPVDASRFGVADGDAVEVGINGTRVSGAAKLRQAIPAGSVFLAEGMADQPASLLTHPIVEVRRTGGPADASPIAPVMVSPAVGEDPADPPRTDTRSSPPGTGINTTGNPS